MIFTVKFERNNIPFTIEDILNSEFNWDMYEITPPCYVLYIYICVYCTDYILHNMIFIRKSLLDTFMQTFVMLLHLVAETLRFKFNDNRVIRTGASDLKLFWAL